MNSIIDDLCCIKQLAESMNDGNWQNVSDKIISIVNAHLADYTVAKHSTAALKPKSRNLKYFGSWHDSNGKTHFCIDQYDSITRTVVSPRDYFIM